MLKIVGISLLVTAATALAGVLALGVGLKSGFAKTRRMAFLAILAFVFGMGGAAVLYGTSRSNVSVYVFGDEGDRHLYDQLIAASPKYYRFYALNFGSIGTQTPLARSCNIGRAADLAKYLTEHANVHVDAELPSDCNTHNAAADLVHPRIDIYLH